MMTCHMTSVCRSNCLCALMYITVKLYGGGGNLSSKLFLQLLEVVPFPSDV